ncbi:hypothetical protein DL769_009449 [Monosporascus sp. CRB-8-3]|nr:hypothetical protein DL769_009449 [Monosporascus sp. CRB-8-3]
MLRYGVSSQQYSKQILAPGSRIFRSFGESRPSKDCNLVIDVIADGGQSWWKVSSMTNKRLVFDMAREAVFCGDSSDDDEGDGRGARLPDTDKMPNTLFGSASHDGRRTPQDRCHLKHVSQNRGQRFVRKHIVPGPSFVGRPVTQNGTGSEEKLFENIEYRHLCTSRPCV